MTNGAILSAVAGVVFGATMTYSYMSVYPHTARLDPLVQSPSRDTRNTDGESVPPENTVAKTPNSDDDQTENRWWIWGKQ